jgi:hypothetical protein
MDILSAGICLPLGQKGGRLPRGLSRVGQRSVGVPGVAGLPWNGWPDALEQVAGFTWNQWPLWPGMGGRLAVESVAGMPRNTQSPQPWAIIATFARNGDGRLWVIRR